MSLFHPFAHLWNVSVMLPSLLQLSPLIVTNKPLCFHTDGAAHSVISNLWPQIRSNTLKIEQSHSGLHTIHFLTDGQEHTALQKLEPFASWYYFANTGSEHNGGGGGKWFSALKMVLPESPPQKIFHGVEIVQCTKAPVSLSHKGGRTVSVWLTFFNVQSPSSFPHLWDYM